MIDARPPLVTRANASDVTPVARIARQCFLRPWDEGVFREELEREFANLLVLRPARSMEPVAFVSFWVVRDEVHVLALATAPACRRRGYARALLTSALAEGRALGARYASLEVRTDNAAARGLYEQLGFQIVGTRHGYYVEDRADADVMLLGMPRHEQRAV